MPRIRHCIECPNCLNRYLVSFSRYQNGSYLIPTTKGASAEFTLHCSCGRSVVAGPWRLNQISACEVSRAAYERGYGTPDEILLINHQLHQPWNFDVSQYLDSWKLMRKEKHPH